MRYASASPGTFRSTLPTFFIAFFACWILLGIGSWIFYAKASYETKKRWHPLIGVGTGIAFLAFAEWITGGHLPWMFAAAVVLIIFLTIRNTQFCSRCGATLYSRGFTRSRFCSRCGADLQEEVQSPPGSAIG
jgi:hypothetical protein